MAPMAAPVAYQDPSLLAGCKRIEAPSSEALSGQLASQLETSGAEAGPCASQGLGI